MRTLGKNIKVDSLAPLTVEEMKDGEWRITESGLYARVGDQILTKGWPGWAQIYDEFNDDDSIPDHVNSQRLNHGI